jgi:AraC-like DNA-binding protein
MRPAAGGVLSFGDFVLSSGDMTALIRSSALSGFVALVRDLGGDAEEMLRRVRLRQRDLAVESGVIPYVSVVRLLDIAATDLGCDDFGLRLSQRQNIEILGPIAIIARNSATVGEALRSIGQFMSFYSSAVAIGIEPVGRSESCLTFDLVDPKIPRRRQTIELSLGIAYNVMRLLTRQRYVPTAVLFRHARGLPAGRYRHYFGVPARFEQAHDALLMGSSYFDMAMDRTDASLRDVVADYVRLVTAQHSLSISDQVVVLVERLLPTMRCDLANVAENLGFHRRTLQRHLAAESLIFEEIVERVRRNRAETYLADRALPMSQVAAMLGYAEQSSFNRACRRWFGATPGARRGVLQRRKKDRSPRRASSRAHRRSQ